MTKALVELGAAVDARDDKGFTPLMIAALRGALEPAAELLLAGADAALTRTSSAGAVESAVDYARLRVRQDEQSPNEPDAKGYVSRAMREEHRALVSVLKAKTVQAARKAAGTSE